MANALALTIQAGQITQVQAGDKLLVKPGVGAGLDLDATGQLTLGGINSTSFVLGGAGSSNTSGLVDTASGILALGTVGATSVSLGRTGQTVTVKGDLQVDGAETVTGSSTFNGNTKIGDTNADSLEVDAELINNGGANNETLRFRGTSDHLVYVEPAVSEGAGGALLFTSGAGGAGAGAAVGGAGGLLSLVAEDGGAASGSFDGGAGGSVVFDAGRGGAGIGGQTAGAGGSLTIQAGASGPQNGGASGLGGTLALNAGAGATDGALTLGTATTNTTTVGATGGPTTAFMRRVDVAGTGVALHTSTGGTSDGASTVGVDTTGFTNSSGNDVHEVLADLDTAVGSGGSTLQVTYAAGNTIDVTTDDGSVDMENSSTGDTATVLKVHRSPAASTGGNAFDVVLGANATGVGVNVADAGSGTALLVNKTAASGNAALIQRSGQTYFKVAGSSALIEMGNATDNPTFDYLGNGEINFGNGKLNVPAGTSFKIGTTALSTANFTAANVDTLLDGSDASALHLHSSVGGADGQFFVTKTSNSTNGISAGSPVAMDNEGGSAVVYDADADSGNERENAIGIAAVAAGVSAAVKIVLVGEVPIPDAQWDGGVPAVGDVGKVAYLSTVAGELTLTAPAGGGVRVLKMGVVSVGGTGAVKVIVPVPDSVKL